MGGKRFELTIELGNEAMSELEDVGAALVKLGEYLRAEDGAAAYGTDGAKGTVRDVNGNTVGRWAVRS